MLGAIYYHNELGEPRVEGGIFCDVPPVSSEALARFLRAKLRVMQEEIDRLCRELTAKVRDTDLPF